MVAKGHGSPEVAEAYARARALGENLGEPLQVELLLIGLWTSALGRDGPAAAQPLADQALAAAERAGYAPARVWAHHAQAATRYYGATSPAPGSTPPGRSPSTTRRRLPRWRRAFAPG